jgi:hypothetical protein
VIDWPLQRRTLLDGVHDIASSEVENPIPRLAGIAVCGMSFQVALKATLCNGSGESDLERLDDPIPGMALAINSVGEGDRSRERRISNTQPLSLGVFLEAELSSWARSLP